ncbi:MAG: site-specific integrase [bacterium]|nr:site-specific integrase [bacterium]
MSKVSPRPGGTRVRRANGSGSVSLRSDGAYDVRVSLPDGSRRRRIVRRKGGETKSSHRRRAEAVVSGMRDEVERGQVVASGHTTVADYASRWIAREQAKSDAGRGLAPSTVSFYRQQFQYYINPHLGSRPLPSLTTGDVERLMDALTAAGRSPRTVQAARNALGRLLRNAKREGLVPIVVTEDASRVRRSTADDDPTTKALDPESIGKLLDAAAGTRWEPLIATLAFLGVRRGEALGLCWDDVDLDSGVVTVRRSLSRVSSGGRSSLVLNPTKTTSSRRPLPPPPILLDLLCSWRAKQGRERLQAGEHWAGHWSDEDFVFTTPVGTPVDPDNLRHALDRLGREAGIGHVHPHQLRHSVASLMIANGHTPPEVARVLGHSSATVTMTYYAHAFDQATAKAADAMATAVAAWR